MNLALKNKFGEFYGERGELRGFAPIGIME